VSSRKNQQKPNGHAGSHGRVNGHAPASTEGGGIPVPRDHAASVDTRRASAAMDARCTVAPGTDCAGYAEVAPSHSWEKKKKNGDRSTTKLRDAILASRTDFAAMQDGSAYVDAVAARVDLVAASVRLVSSEDEKIAKAELDRLREMKFGKVGPAANVTDAPAVVWDVPGVNVSRNEG
jgi:hypothetical protein